ncbi:MAG: class I SAM-dependent methyltransferase [Prolixibacteraceae bacterium]|nr:class I SAM-dependent methyltransferase [Prolixibacteraceae bacterium]
MKAEFWNTRYAEPGFAYGEAPNEFFQEELLKLTPGKLLLPAEGEGRNAVFAALKGWEVKAFDQSSEGMAKAKQLAKQQGVAVHFDICDFEHFDPGTTLFDCIALIFFHPPAQFRSAIHHLALAWLRPGGKLIVEAFAKEQINEQSGGPKDPDMLFSREELANDFRLLSDLNIETATVWLNEGTHHQGPARVIRVIGEK